ncbi:PKD domain-containing protein [bacterium]|nr:PKD domain-containing protein [bacterium]
MRSLRVLLFTAIMICAAAAYGAESDEIYLYKGGNISQDNISISGWGSGKAVESREKVLNGSNSIKVITQGYYAGGCIDFGQPIPISSFPAEKNRYITFTFFFPDIQSVDPAAGTGYSFEVEPYTVPKVNKVRFMFEMEDGSKFSLEEPTRELDPDDNWVRVPVPLSRFRTAVGSKDLKVKQICIFSDVPATMYLGEIKLMTDATPIKADSLGEQVVAVQDNVFLVGSAEGGISNLKYSWDFDNRNGIQQEQSGKVARFVFTHGGDFTVTLTVSDTDGVKAPVSVTGVISVND